MDKLSKSEYGNLKAKFLAAYANLPEPETMQVIAIINEKPYSWNAANAEIVNDTKLGQQILEKMKLLGLL